jgi:glycosyltransferase involved in cell wall biosynthesis
MATIIRVMAARQARGLGGTLLIGGDGGERTRLEALAAELGVTPVVRFLGAIPLHQVPEVIAAADVFLLDTAYEGLSHQLLEVMAAGVPIITTPVGGNVELITHEVEGLLVPVGDIAAYDQAIDRLLDDEALRTNMVAHAKLKAAQFAGHDAVAALAKRLENL